MRKFLKHIFLFTLIMVCLFSVLTFLIDRGLYRSNTGDIQVWNEIRRGHIDANVLVLGNSHAAVQIDPRVLEAELAATAYNIGVPGYGFDLQVLRYNYYRQANKKPQLLVLVVANNQFQPTTLIPDIRSTLPFAGFEGFASPDIPLIGRVYHYLPFLKYHQEWLLAVEGLRLMIRGPRTDSLLYHKGYQGLDRTWPAEGLQQLRSDPSPIYPVANEHVSARFEAFLEKCRQDTVKVVLLVTPDYYESSQRLSGRAAYYRAMQETGAEYGAAFIDMNNDPLSRIPGNYADASHLNRNAARELTRHLTDSLIKKGLWPLANHENR